MTATSANLTLSYERTLEADVQMQEAVIANLTSALQRSADEREDTARRAKEREELLEAMLEDLKEQLDARTLELAAAASRSAQNHSMHALPKSLSPDAVWESGSEEDFEASQSAASYPPDSNHPEEDGDGHTTDDCHTATSGTATGTRRNTDAVSRQRTSGTISKSQSVGRQVGRAKGSSYSASPSPLGHSSPTNRPIAASSPPRKGGSTNRANLGPLLKYQGLLSGSVRHQDPHSSPISISRTYKELLKYQSLDPSVHEYLVTLENENKSLRREVDTVNKTLRERESEHERIRTMLQKRVSAAEESSRSLAHQAATLEGELQSMKRLYNDTADELAKMLTVSSSGGGGGGLGASVSGGGGPVGRRSSYSHFNTFHFGD
jgi:hypothetical protein